LPPTVGEKTTYTVFWQVENSWNDVNNVKVKTQLPDNVFITGSFFPEEAKFTYDSVSREIVWNVGDVEAFSGGDGEPITLAFQIEFIPDSSQIGKKPLLISETDILGEDSFTGEILHEKALGVDTTLPDDDTVSEVQGIVRGSEG